MYVDPYVVPPLKYPHFAPVHTFIICSVSNQQSAPDATASNDMDDDRAVTRVFAVLIARRVVCHVLRPATPKPSRPAPQSIGVTLPLGGSSPTPLAMHPESFSHEASS